MRWNSWTWRTATRVSYGLFVVALLMAVVRVCALFTADYMAAQAVVEAVTQLRRRVYHHTFRLGTLAFRALGPTEAVGVSTPASRIGPRGLLAWLTVYFREPVKFGLLLFFAMLVDFWLALAFLLFAVLVWLIGGQIAAYFRREGRLATLKAANELALIQESLMLMRLVKVYLMEHFNQTRVERQFSSYARAQLTRYRGEAMYRPLFLFLGLLAQHDFAVRGGLCRAARPFERHQYHDSRDGAGEPVLAERQTGWSAGGCCGAACESAKIVFDFLERPGSVGQMIEAEFLPA